MTDEDREHLESLRIMADSNGDAKWAVDHIDQLTRELDGLREAGEKTKAALYRVTVALGRPPWYQGNPDEPDWCMDDACQHIWCIARRGLSSRYAAPTDSQVVERPTARPYCNCSDGGIPWNLVQTWCRRCNFERRQAPAVPPPLCACGCPAGEMHESVLPCACRNRAVCGCDGLRIPAKNPTALHSAQQAEMCSYRGCTERAVEVAHCREHQPNANDIACACPRRDAGECAVARDSVHVTSTELSDEQCDCWCHETSEDADD